jgi:hypothetical protein
LQEKRGSYSAVLRQLRENFCAENSILRPAVNPIGRLHPEKYISLGHKHLAGGNRVAGKKGFLFSRFKTVGGKLLCLKFNLEAGR